MSSLNISLLNVISSSKTVKSKMWSKPNMDRTSQKHFINITIPKCTQELFKLRKVSSNGQYLRKKCYTVDETNIYLTNKNFKQSSSIKSILNYQGLHCHISMRLIKESTAHHIKKK